MSTTRNILKRMGCSTGLAAYTAFTISGAMQICHAFSDYLNGQCNPELHLERTALNLAVFSTIYSIVYFAAKSFGSDAQESFSRTDRAKSVAKGGLLGLSLALCATGMLLTIHDLIDLYEGKCNATVNFIDAVIAMISALPMIFGFSYLAYIFSSPPSNFNDSLALESGVANQEATAPDDDTESLRPLMSR